MKKIYALFGAAALLMLGSCAKDGEVEQRPDAKGGEMFMSLSIASKGSTGTRTETPNQGKEEGQDFENKISDGLLVFTKKEGTTYKVFQVAEIKGTDIAGVNPAVATFELSRQAFVDDVKSEQTYYLFMIANATQAGFTTSNVSKDQDVQRLFELTVQDDGTVETEDKFWKNNNFLMTNAELCKLILNPDNVKEGTHTTQADALNLGTVRVQRAMSRFDIATGDDYTKFTATAENDKSFLKDITVTFDGVALVNMAQKANLFKVVADNDTNLPTMTLAENLNETLMWGAPAETATNYVFSPVQTKWAYPLFGNTLDSGNSDKWKQGNQATSQPQKDLSSLTYTSIATLKSPDNPFYIPATSSSAYAKEDYYIWRYCMENTNYDNLNQLNGNTTGVVFRAEITSTSSEFDGTNAIYAYNSFIIGTAEQLKTYVTGADPKDGQWSTVKTKYEDAVAKLKEKTPEWDGESNGELSDLDEYLVANSFSIYRAKEGKYYCYYVYWNRHNDNDDAVKMGPMEFATVRNNVYKLRVDKVLRLGHPAEPGDDPDPTDPDDPDEKDKFYAEISCKILPWEVRMNGIEF